MCLLTTNDGWDTIVDYSLQDVGTRAEPIKISM
jgi:hypothetical protein